MDALHRRPCSTLVSLTGQNDGLIRLETGKGEKGGGIWLGGTVFNSVSVPYRVAVYDELMERRHSGGYRNSAGRGIDHDDGFCLTLLCTAACSKGWRIGSTNPRVVIAKNQQTKKEPWFLWYYLSYMVCS